MTELSNETFAGTIQGSKPVLVDFWAEWCMPCKIFAPALEELSDELDGQAEFCKVNVDDCGPIAAQYGIASIPTVVLFRNGEELDRMVGVQPKDKVREMVNRHL